MLPKEVVDKKKEIISYLKGIGVSVDKIKDQNLLLQVFVHKSFAADYKNMTDHNERLEFLGDGVLGAIINKLLFLNHPEMAESDLTLYKIGLVREENLAEVAKDINLDKMIFISKGEEKTEWRKKNAIISDCLEALIWFLYVDLWIEQTEAFIQKYVYSKITAIQTEPIKSYKTMIQEIIQKKYKILPEYVDSESKTDEKGNVLEYKSEIFALGKKQAEGFGTNKKKAQEEAAKSYYNLLQK